MTHFPSNLSTWMTDLPEKLRDLPIIHLAIPGSHDSGTWTINKHSHFAPDLDRSFKHIKWLGIIARLIISNWSKTQDYSIYKQLEVGIRYFDIRIATKISAYQNKDFYIVHGLYGPPVRQVLEEIAYFLNKYQKEILIFDCQHFYEMTNEDHNKLATLIFEHFRGKIVHADHVDIQQLSMTYMNANNFQIIMVYRHPNCYLYKFFPSSSYPTPWPDTTRPDELINILTINLHNRNENLGYVTQFILTPRTSTIIFHLFTGKLKKFSGWNLLKKKLHWIKEQKPGNKGVNVIIADFINISAHEFCRSVIALNAKLFVDIMSNEKIEASSCDKLTS